jgi:hypothetical protein
LVGIPPPTARADRVEGHVAGMTISWLLMAAHVPAGGQRGGMVRYVVEFAKAISTHPDVELHVVADPAATAFWQPIVGDTSRIHPMTSRAHRGAGAHGAEGDGIRGVPGAVRRRPRGQTRVAEPPAGEWAADSPRLPAPRPAGGFRSSQAPVAARALPGIHSGGVGAGLCVRGDAGQVVELRTGGARQRSRGPAGGRNPGVRLDAGGAGSSREAVRTGGGGRLGAQEPAVPGRPLAGRHRRASGRRPRHRGAHRPGRTRSSTRTRRVCSVSVSCPTNSWPGPIVMPRWSCARAFWKASGCPHAKPWISGRG